MRTAADVVPEPVRSNRAANRCVHVPDFLQLIRPEQTRGLQGVGVVRTLHRAVREVAEQRASDRIAALTRHDVHHGPAGFRLAEAACRAEVDFLAVADVDNVERRAAAADRGADRQPVDLQAPFAQPPAVHREHNDGRSGEAAHVLRARCVHAGHEIHDAVVHTRRGNGADDVVGQRLLALHALHVDDWRLAGHRDRLFHCADTQIRVDGRGKCSRELDAFAFGRAEAGEDERHTVSAGPQVLNPVLPAAVGNRRACLLDQLGARGLDGDTRQHGARAVFDGAHDRALSECGAWCKGTREHCRQLDE